MDVFEFMAHMLYFMPEKHGKQICWYGICANGEREKLSKIRKNTRAMAVKHCLAAIPNAVLAAEMQWCALWYMRRTRCVRLNDCGGPMHA